ncbi:MAG: SMI1/KNR4 family protein [Gammaproteobacteria bacterium]|nr:SMI1/KNR4 family protein [Gammaproteobacteria bacterium]MBU1442262.1 SMI1/KNR4 family protein [Gammaproteobacteria bacterium]MBU2407103.1 SMI1/KNR4 family protein [Gammaproteobacteria bacterium]
MKIDEFREIDQRARRSKPKLFLLASPDSQASEEALADLQRVIGVQLPVSYRVFLNEFGGGNFGLTTVFSADPNSEWYLSARLDEVRKYLPSHVLPFSDDFAGGLYVFEVVDGQALEPVFYWNEDGGLVPTKFANILEFIARYAYEGA